MPFATGVLRRRTRILLARMRFYSCRICVERDNVGLYRGIREAKRVRCLILGCCETRRARLRAFGRAVDAKAPDLHPSRPLPREPSRDPQFQRHYPLSTSVTHRDPCSLPATSSSIRVIMLMQAGVLKGDNIRKLFNYAKGNKASGL